MGTRAAIYARISDDRAGGGLGVARQVADCSAHARSLGWSVVEVYEDNDQSAYSGKRRPGYQRLMEAIARGELDGVIAWHTDRLHRSLAELESFITACEEHRVRIETVRSGTLDLSTPAGRLVARLLGSAARYEVEHKSERARRKARELAEAGKLNGGGTRPFGFESNGLTVRKSEATVIRQLAERLLAGETLGSLCRWLNTEEIPTSTGGEWSLQTLRRMLMSARISGQRAHGPEIVGKAEWPAIITPEQTTRIRALLMDPARRTNRSARRYLLTGGLIVCGRCGTRMVGRPKEDGRKRYVCAGPPQGKGCGRMYILTDDVDELVTKSVLYRLDTEELADALSGRAGDDTAAAEAQEELAAARKRLMELSEMLGAGELTRAQFVAAKRKVEHRELAAQQILNASTKAAALDSYIGTGAALSPSWDSMNLDRQRAIVSALVESVHIGPAVRGRNTFDPDRITIMWKV